jgi:hypothetical protein
MLTDEEALGMYRAGFGAACEAIADNLTLGRFAGRDHDIDFADRAVTIARRIVYDLRDSLTEAKARELVTAALEAKR